MKAVTNNVSDKQLLDFCLSYSNFLKAVVAKRLNKTAVQYPLANNLAFLDSQHKQEQDMSGVCIAPVSAVYLDLGVTLVHQFDST